GGNCGKIPRCRSRPGDRADPLRSSPLPRQICPSSNCWIRIWAYADVSTISL
ncbi:hypothetical protein AVDCRST_MAG84-6181, partial [uncultured Microcoleus sp.]